MLEQYFGTKELFQVVLKTTVPIKMGKRVLKEGEPILYFRRVKLATVSQISTAIMAQGGLGNQPLVIWENRDPIRFRLSEGIMTRTGLGILLGAEIAEDGIPVRLPKTESPITLDQNGRAELKFDPIPNDRMFCYEYEFNTIQNSINFTLDGNIIDCGIEYANRSILVEYYFYYDKDTKKYLVKKELFNSGNFSLEGRFYIKDENEGMRKTNVLIMPKIRVNSNINLKLGEHVDPTMSTFEMIAMPTKTINNDFSIMEIISLDEDIDADI